MNYSKDVRERCEAAYKLLTEEITTREKFESVRTLIKGINPQVDKLLEESSKKFADYEKLHKGQIVELSAEKLPEETEDEKRRKKLLLLFIRSWKQLKSEVHRMQVEIEQMNQESSVDKVKTGGRIVRAAKGPLGIITIAAILIVASLMLLRSNNVSQTTPTSSSAKPTIQVITFNDKKIPLGGLTTGQGVECMTGSEQALHYHAKDHTATTTLDGSTIQDPGGCGFGKVNEITIEEVQMSE